MTGACRSRTASAAERTRRCADSAQDRLRPGPQLGRVTASSGTLTVHLPHPRRLPCPPGSGSSLSSPIVIVARTDPVGDHPAAPNRAPARRASGPSTTAPSTAPAGAGPPRPSCAIASGATTSSSCGRSRRWPARASWTPGRDAGRVRRRPGARDPRRRPPHPERDARSRLSRVEDFDDRAALVSVDHPRSSSATAGRTRSPCEHRRRHATPKTCASPCRTTARSSSSWSRGHRRRS